MNDNNLKVVLSKVWKRLGTEGVIKSERDEAVVKKIMDEYGVPSIFGNESLLIKNNRSGE